MDEFVAIVIARYHTVLLLISYAFFRFSFGRGMPIYVVIVCEKGRSCFVTRSRQN